MASSEASGKAAAGAGGAAAVAAAAVVEADARYVGGIRVYNTGLLDDPIPGSKRGKGVQQHNSSVWLSALATFIAEELPALQAVVALAAELDAREREEKGDLWQSEDAEGLAPCESVAVSYLVNQANLAFTKSEVSGLRDTRSWLLSSFLALLAAELDHFNYSKYSPERRIELRKQYFKDFAAATVVQPTPDQSKAMGDLYLPPARFDLLPRTALERLALHNELVREKLGDKADEWKRSGFPLSARIGSTKRHFDGVHARDRSEDHIAHLAWNLQACYHVAHVFPHLNDLPITPLAEDNEET